MVAAAGASAYTTLRPEDEAADTGGVDSTSTTTGGGETSDGQITGTTVGAETQVVEWVMPTSWPTALEILWNGAQAFADRVAQLSGGGFRISAEPAGRVTAERGILPAVSSGQFPVGLTSSYYHVDESPVMVFGSAVPFGLTPRQHSAWMYNGGGLDLLREHSRRNFNVIQFPAGNTGAHMGGWFNQEVVSLDDLQGLRMRISGMGASVMQRLGAEVFEFELDGLLNALASDDVDAAEFSGPFDDASIGLQLSGGFYYFPGFWEVGSSVDLFVNGDAWDRLPEAYRQAFEVAAFESVVKVTAEYDARNGETLNALVAAGTELRQFPDDILQAGRAASGLVLDEIAATNADFSTILNEFRNFRRQVAPWFTLSQLPGEGL